MARYGGFLYGDELYGFQAETYPVLSWGFEVDWDNDGLFDGTNEAGYIRKLKVTRGRQNYLKTDGTGFEPVREGEFIAELMNTDGRFDPYNAASPLYPRVVPGCRFRLRVADNATGIVYPVMTGRITDIRPIDERLSKVTVRGVDDIRLLKEARVNAAVQAAYGADDAAGDILTAAGWTDSREIDLTSDAIPYWWGAGRTAYEELTDLAEFVLGRFFITADGAAALQTRHSLPANVATIHESDILKGIALPQPWEVVRNAISAQVNTRTAQATAELWRLRDVPSIPAGGSITIWANYTYSNQPCAAQNVVTPVATTDYTMNAAADGSGANLTAGFTVTATKYSEKAKLVVTNGSASTGYITLLKVRGDALALVSVSTVDAENTTSIATYRRREFALNNPWLQNSNTAKDLTSWLKDFLASPRAFPLVRLRAKPAVQFAMDLFDRVTLDFPGKFISGDYLVGAITHEWDEPTGNKITTTARFEPATFTDGLYWRFPALMGTDTIFAY